MKKGSAYSLHDHDFAEVFLVEEGEGIHRVNGKRLPLIAGQLIMIRPADAHGFEVVDEKGFVVSNVAFSADLIANLSSRYYPNDLLFFGGKQKMPLSIMLPNAIAVWLSAAFAALVQGPRDRLSLDRFLLNLLYELSRIRSRPLAQGPDWLSRACAEIQKPEHFKGGTPAFCLLCGHGAEHVSRTAKKMLGVTPTDLVNNARTDYAAGQLTLTEKKIDAIARECGFENLGHFYRVFKKRFNETPRQYRVQSGAVFR
jgi:AraC family cel operon transcriptional repressor